MNAGCGRRIGDRLKEFVPPAIRSRPDRAIATPILPNDQNLRIRSGGQNVRQGAHEAVIPSVGFQLATDKRKNLAARGKLWPTVPQIENRCAVRAQYFGVDPVVNHIYPVADEIRVRVGLPSGWRQYEIGADQGMGDVGLMGQHPDTFFQAVVLEFRVKPHIQPLGAIKEL